MGTPRYELNEDYFASIDTEAKAYWLGFIAADGCLPPLRGDAPRRVTIKLAATDAAHLESLRTAIGYTGPLYYNSTRPGRRVEEFCRDMPPEGYPAATLSIGRHRFVSHLVRHGIGPRKSDDLEPPGGGIPKHLLRHYWRGLFDGDGTIYRVEGNRRGRRYSEWSVGLFGTLAIAQGFAAFVRDAIGVMVSVSPHVNIWRALTSGSVSPQAVARLLYSGSTVHLQRKKDRADELLATVPLCLKRSSAIPT